MPHRDWKSGVYPPFLNEITQLREIQCFQLFSFVSHVRLWPPWQSTVQRPRSPLPAFASFPRLPIGSQHQSTSTPHAFSKSPPLLPLDKAPKIGCPDREEWFVGQGKPHAHRIWALPWRDVRHCRNCPCRRGRCRRCGGPITPSAKDAVQVTQSHSARCS